MQSKGVGGWLAWVLVRVFQGKPPFHVATRTWISRRGGEKQEKYGKGKLF